MRCPKETALVPVIRLAAGMMPPVAETGRSNVQIKRKGRECPALFDSP
jgi:hypothetical protein